MTEDQLNENCRLWAEENQTSDNPVVHLHQRKDGHFDFHFKNGFAAIGTERRAKAVMAAYCNLLPN